MTRPPQSGETYRGNDMVDYVKIVVKNINQDLLQEEMVAAGVAGGGAY